ncbi:MAG: ABZJ_00895 family protein [Paracoccaceae bacterium]
MQTNQPSLGSVTLIYIAFYIGIAVLINVVLWAAETFAGFKIEASAVGWMPLILGAMMAGQHYGAKAGAKPPQGYAWMAGLIFTIVSILLSVAVLYVMALALGLDIPGSIAQLRAEAGDDAALIAGILGGVLLLIWVLQRFIFSVGAGQGAKQAALRK